MPQLPQAQPPRVLVNEPDFSIQDVAATLESAAQADIWYDAAKYGDEGPLTQIEQAQNAMEKVAKWLMESNPTPALGGPLPPSLTELRTRQILAAAQLALNALSQSAAEPGTKQWEIEDEAALALRGVLSELNQQETTTARNRVLITVSGGSADYVCDPGLDVAVFDHDNYAFDPARTGGVPARFADLATPLEIPVDGGSPLSQEATKTLAVIQMQRALAAATDAGVFDEMAASVHPDVINRFCDAVSDEFAARTHTDDTGDDAAPMAAPGG